MKLTKFKKLIIILIVFMMLFSNFGYTISVIAASEEFEIIKNGFFEKEEIEFDVYFEDDDKKSDEKISDVNKTMKLNVKVAPNVEGYIESATIKAVSDDENINFRIKNIEAYAVNTDTKQEQISNDLVEDEKNVETEETENEVIEDTENVVVPSEENIIKNEVENNFVNESDKNNVEIYEDENPSKIENTTKIEQNVINNPENQTFVDLIEEQTSVNITEEIGDVNTTLVNIVEEDDEKEEKQNTNNFVEITEEEVIEEKDKEDNSTTDVIENTNEKEQEEILIDEEKVIEEKVEENEEFDILSNEEIISENEVKISNIIEETIYVLELEYVQGENLKVEDLYKEISIQLSGTFINSDLEKIEIAKEEKVIVGWEYNKDIELMSEYTKFSPFKVGEKVGTIVENKVTIKREIDDEKYLPLKTTIVDISVPTLNGKAPVEVSILANKLLATRGEDIGQVTFNEENWMYDSENKEITIIVNNEKDGKIINTSGEDEFIIIYRFEDFEENATSKLNRNIKVTVEQYNGKEIKILKKEITDNQEIDVNVGELVTYSINSSEEKIEKSRIYANYNSEDALYETEYTNFVTLNILTSDMLEQIKIDCSKEYYKDINGYEFEAKEIKYKNIKFNYSEIKYILEKGGNVEIHNLNGELLYTLNNNLIKNEEDCLINLNYVDGIIVYINNISANGTINFEVTKVIKKCNYEKSAFKNFTEIESRITAGVKYLNLDETLTLQEITTTKQLKESYTRANLYINKEDLTTIQENEDVELRIELNNDKIDSDLYINPSFEFVFPKYVKKVTVENINLLYENGLRISDFHTYTESDIVKMRIELTGTQKTFSENTITNGTNIVVNVKIKLDEYTPSKQDQIKMYYCNEGVTNYESQTKWTVSKLIPNGILKTTNGFDVALIRYQAPKGMVAINGIINYDGNLSEVKSVKQGEKMVQIPISDSSRVATMELLALNNTENECSEMIMLGRTPFKGNKDVVTQQDLGTTTTSLMKDFIKEDVQNFNMTTIYYSTNENATKDLENPENGWKLKEEIQDVTTIKSYMIVVKGNVAAGAVLRYTYEFEIPENLPYEVSMAGSFGIYYNNNTDVAIVYESVSADKVGLKTEVGPKIEASLSVDIGDGIKIQARKRMKYTVKVINSGSIVANDVKIEAPIPKYTNYVEKTEQVFIGDYGFIQESVKKTVEYNIPTLNPGETKEFSYYVQAGRKPFLEEYASDKDEKGYYVLENGENKYITEVPQIYIINQATVTVPLLANKIKTNETMNELVSSTFYSEIRVDFDRQIEKDFESNFTLVLTNESNKDLTNVVAVFNMGHIYNYKEGSIDGENKDITINEQEGKVYFNIGNMKQAENKTLKVKLVSKKINKGKETVDCYFDFIAEGIEPEKSTVIPQTVVRPLLESRDITVLVPEKINENEEITISTEIENVGSANCKNAYMEVYVPEELEVNKIISENTTMVYKREGENIKINLPLILEGESISIDIVLKSKNIDGSENTDVFIERIIKNEDQKDIILDLINFMIINNEKTEDEIEQERIDELEKEYEEEQKKYEEQLKEYEEQQKNENDKNENNNDINNSDSSNEIENNESQENNQGNTNIENNDSNNSESNDNQAQEQPSEDNIQNEINPPEEKTKYFIKGIAWLDENKNGTREDSEKMKSGVKVYLLKNNNMIKSTITKSDGEYIFEGLEEGKYIVAFSYEADIYKVTTYKKGNLEDNRNSDVIEVNMDNISAITNEIYVTNTNLENIDIGLQERERFDLSINKYISSITVNTEKESKTYKYDNLDIAKVEIHSKQIKNAQVDLEYTIEIKNVGSTQGYIEEIVDLLPSDMQFSEELNTNWYKGSDGNLYVKEIKNTIFKPGDKKVIKLKVSKNMTEENTGIVSNKVEFKNAHSKEEKDVITENNSSIQNTFILVSTGRAKQIANIVISIIIAAIIAYVFKSQIKFKKNEKYTEKKKKIYK